MVIILKINCAVLGCTGIVGQRFIQLLENHPYFDLKVIIASKKNSGKIYKEAVNWLIEKDIPPYIKNTEINTFNLKVLEKNDVKIVFSALPPDIAKIVEKKLIENGFIVFSNSRAFRYSKNVPILIPEINSDHIDLVKLQLRRYKGFIITNANCTTTGLVIALKPLLDFKIKNVFVSTYQSLSGAGYPGVSSLDINGNVIPFIDGEEEKIQIETNKILGKINRKNNLNIISSCARVPVIDGHLESVVVELEKNVKLSSVKRAFNNFLFDEKLPTSPRKTIILKDEENRPQPIKDANNSGGNHCRGMSVTIGRLKKQGNYLRFWLVVHNTIRGAAGNSILNAEYAYKNGFLKR